MSFIKTTGEKKLMLFSGRAHPELAEEVGEQLGIELTPTTAYDFANGEIFVRYKESVRGCDAFVHPEPRRPLNKWLMEQLIMVDALKRASAKRITVVTPFYGYARQDKKHRGREPISARLMADLFKTAGADRLMAVDLHTVADPGLLRRPGRPPVRPAAAGQLRQPPGRPVQGHGRLARLRPRAARGALVRDPRRRPDRVHPQDPRPAGAQRVGGQPGRR